MMNTQQNLTLYQIGKEYQALLAQLYNPETGEVNLEVDAKLNELAPTAEEKCKSVANWIKHIQSEKKTIEFMKEEILKREQAYEKEIQQKTDYLKYNMQQFNIQEIKCPFFTIKLKKNPYGTDILDENLIPEKYMRTREVIKKETKADKNAIKEEVLKTGIQVPGAHVHQKTKLEIVIDKI